MTTAALIIVLSLICVLLFGGFIILLKRINKTNSLIQNRASQEILQETIHLQNNGYNREENVINKVLPISNEVVRTTTPDVISFPAISTGNGANSFMSFIKTQTESLSEDLIPITLSKEQSSNLSSTMSSLAGVSIGVGAQALAVKGLYRATASASQLMKYADGTLSSMIKSGGQFAKHAGFTSAGLSAVAPVAIFQIAAAVTGQYYMNIITKQLKKLDESVQSILQKLEAMNRAELRAIQKNIESLAYQEQYTPDDLVVIRQYMNRALVLYYNYVDQISGKTSDNEIKRIIVSDSSTWAKDIRLTRENLESKELQYLCDIAETAFKSFVILELVYFKMLCLSGQNDPSYLSKIDHIITSFRTNQFEDTEYIKGIRKLQCEVKIHLNKAKDNAISYTEKINQEGGKIDRYFNGLLNGTDTQMKELRLARQSIVKRFDKPQELYYDATDPDNVKVYIKKSSD